jgi:hypothetical protein
VVGRIAAKQFSYGKTVTDVVTVKFFADFPVRLRKRIKPCGHFLTSIG